jgi:phosphoglycolate phosphatase
MKNITSAPRLIRAVLFDMDGTLVDTLPDIAAAMNEALAEMRLQPLSAERIGVFIGKGPRSLAMRVLDEQPSLDAAQRLGLVDALIAGYVKHYEPRIGTAARAYPGVRDALVSLRSRGFQLAVVTNAMQHLAERVLARFDLLDQFSLVLGGDRVARGKPDAGPLLEACRVLGVTPAEALMVGDSENDVIAARAAGCPVVVVPYGYNAGQPASSLGCDIVENFTALPAWVANFAPTAN